MISNKWMMVFEWTYQTLKVLLYLWLDSIPIKHCLSNEKLCICVARGAGKQSKVKVWGLKKMSVYPLFPMLNMWSATFSFFSALQLNFSIFASPWAKWMCNISFESPHIFWLVKYLLKGVAAFFRSHIFIQITLICMVLI